MIEPSVVVIILNWNNVPDTIECLRSFEGQDYPNYELLVVDNGSTDGSAAAICEAFPEVEILRLPENLGYAEGNNRGIAQALAADPGYLLLLNNDVVVDRSLVTELVAIAERDPSVGMTGPVIYHYDRPRTIFAAGSTLDWRRGDHAHLLMDAEDAQWAAGEERAGREVDYIVGTAVCVRRSVVEEIGLLDGRYYLNYEDIDWCVRARRHGYKVLVAPAGKLWHKVSSTLGQTSAANTYYMTRNGLLFFRSHLRGPAQWRVMTRLVLGTLRTICAWSLIPEYRGDVFRRKRDANLLALRDYCLGRFGPMGQDVARVCYSG